MKKALALLLILPCWLLAAEPAQPQGTKQDTEEQAQKRSDFPPLMERYILDELKSIRSEMLNFKADVRQEVADREMHLSERALGYSSSTVTYFFYLIAGGASLLAVVGWQSLREIKQNTKKFADEEIKRLTKVYESRLIKLEQELRRKTSALAEHHREIEKLNEIHSLWLKASQEASPQNKIEIYDEILRMRPGDLDALTHKADAALMLGEKRWALSICNRVLAVDGENAHALYQRACALAGLGHRDRALSDLAHAVSLSESLRDTAREEEDFESLQGSEEFENLVNPPVA
ncbi:tetratricopeptide repeat protein [Gallaecimonas sp. GXIMD4217]|uniref:tetratricopeptide repeat protein n=1 Tax=Gallaecimonas sp. GXIMD4217 TaxID=3131927 RepID=UPI00311B2A44